MFAKPLVVLGIFSFVLPSSVQAFDTFSDTFDSPTYHLGRLAAYRPGDPLGQLGWYTFNGSSAENPQVENTIVRSGDQAFSVNSNPGSAMFTGMPLRALSYSDDGPNKIYDG